MENKSYEQLTEKEWQWLWNRQKNAQHQSFKKERKLKLHGDTIHTFQIVKHQKF